MIFRLFGKSDPTKPKQIESVPLFTDDHRFGIYIIFPIELRRKKWVLLFFLFLGLSHKQHATMPVATLHVIRHPTTTLVPHI